MITRKHHSAIDGEGKVGILGSEESRQEIRQRRARVSKSGTREAQVEGCKTGE